MAVDPNLDPKEIDRLRQLLLAVEGTIDNLSFQNLISDAKNTRREIAFLQKQLDDMNQEVQSLADNLSKTVQELRKSESGASQTAKALRNVQDISRQILNHQQGGYQISADDADLMVIKLQSEQKRLEFLQKQFKLEKEFLEKKKKENEDLENNLKTEIKDLESKNKLNKEEEKLLKEKKGLLNEVVSKNSNIPQLLIANQDAHDQINKLLGEESHKYKTLVDYAKQIRVEQENLESALGITGAAIDGISKSLERMGLGALADRIGLDKAKNRMKEFAYEITEGGKKSAGIVGQFKILSVGISSLGRSIMKNLTDPLVLAGLAAKGVSVGVGLIKKGFSLLKGGIGSVLGFVKNLWSMADSFAAVFEKYAKAGQFAAQNFSAVGGQVNAIRAGLNAAAKSDPFMRVAEAGPALKAIVDGTGVMQSQMTKSVKDAHDLTYWLGYSAEETGKLYKLGELQNKGAKEYLGDIKAQGALLNSKYKTSQDLRKIEQIALKASASVTYNLKQNPKALAEAAFHAAKLNMTLDEIQSAAEQTLNFESSIQNQLEYQALTGREINIDAYQQAALRGDTVTAAKELDRILQSQGSAIEGNVLNQEALAKTLGISKDKLLEAKTQQKLVNKFGADRITVEKTLQELMDKHHISREEAAKRMSQNDIKNQLAASKRAEAMSRALEDFRDYMATRLWPLFKAVFSPANIKMFMSVISGMRPVFVELGKAITAFFSPKSAGAMTDVIKNDVMPAILDLAKMVTEVAGVLGEALFGVIKTLGPVIKKDVIPIFKYIGSIIKEIAPSVGSLVKALAGGLAKVFSKINEHKEDIRNFIEVLANGLTNVFGFVANHLKEIALTLVAFKALTAVRSLKNAILGSPGSSMMNPMYVKNVGVPGGGGGGGGMMSKLKATISKGAKSVTTSTAGTMGSLMGTTSFATKRQMVAARQAAGKGLGSKTTPLTTTAAPTSFAAKRQMVAARQAAGQGLGSKVTAGAAGGLTRGSSPMNPLFVKEVGKITGGAPGAAAKAGAAPLTTTAAKGVTSATTAAPLATTATKGAAAKAAGAAPLAATQGKFYPGGQFLPGGGKAPKGGITIPPAGGAAAPLTTTAAPTSFAAKRKMVAARQAAGQGLGSKVVPPPPPPSGVGGAASKLGAGAGAAGSGAAASGSKLSKFGSGLGAASGGMLQGAAAIAVLAGALFIAAKAFQEFSEVKWSGVLKGTIALAVLAKAAIALGSAGPMMIAGGAAVALLAGSLYLAAKGLQEFASVKWESIGKGLTVIGGLAIMAAALGAAGPAMIAGGAAVALLSASLYIAAKGLQEFASVQWESVGKGLTVIGSLAIAAALLGAAGPAMIAGGAAVALLAGSLWIAAKGIQEFALVNPEDMEKAGGALSRLALVALALSVAGPAMIAGGAAVAILAGSLYIAAKGLQEFVSVDPESISKASDMLGKLTLAALALSVAGPSMIAGGAAVALLAGSLWLAAKGLQEFASVNPDDLDKAGKALIGLSAAALVLSLGGPAMIIGAAALGVLAGAMWLSAKAIQEFANVTGESLNTATTSLYELTKASLAIGLASPALILAGGAMVIFGAGLNVVASSLLSLQEAVGGGKLATLGDDLGKGLTAITTGLKDVDFGDLIGTFMALSAAFFFLDLDAITEFAALADADLGKAADSLMSGIKKLTELDPTATEGAKSDADFEKLTEDIKKRLEPLQGINDAFEDAIDELDLEDLMSLSKMSGQGLSDAITGLMTSIKTIATADFGKLSLDNVRSVLSDIEDVFEDLEDAIDEIDFDQLKRFGDSASANLGEAARNVVNGINEMAQIKTPVETVSGSVKEAFRQFNIIMSGLNVKAFTAFAELAKTDLGKAMNDFIGSLNSVGTNLQPITDTNAEKIKASFKAFNDSISQLKLEPPKEGGGGGGLLAFAQLANVDLSKAAEQLKKGMDGFETTFIDAQTKSAKVYNFTGIGEAFKAFNAVILGIDLEAFKKLGDLAAADLAAGALKVSQGLEGIKDAFKEKTADSYKFLEENIKPIFEKIALVFGKDSAASQSLATLEAFAKADFSKFSTSVVAFKSGIESFKDLETITVDLSSTGAIAKLFANLNAIFNPKSEKGEGLNIDNLVKFGTSDFSKFKTSVKGLKEGLIELQGVTDSFTTISKDTQGADVKNVDTFDNIKKLMENVSGAFSNENVSKLADFASKDFSKFPSSIANIKTALASTKDLSDNQTSLETLKNNLFTLSLAIQNIDLTSIVSIANASKTFNTLKTALTNLVNAFNTLATLKSSAASQLKELASIDSSKLITLSEAVIKLSDSFVVLAKTLADMGDITKIVTISEQMLKLHESVSKNAIKDPEKLAEGVGAIFSGLMGSLVSFVEGGGQGVSDKFFKGATGKIANDMVSLPGTNRMFTGPEGTLNINDKDTVIAGTNLFGESTLPAKIASSTVPTVEYSALLEEFREFRKMMASNKDQPIVINTQLNLDGEVVAKNTEEKLRTRRQRI